MARDQEMKEQGRICKKGKEMVTESRPVRCESSSVRKGQLRLMHPCASQTLCHLSIALYAVSQTTPKPRGLVNQP